MMGFFNDLKVGKKIACLMLMALLSLCVASGMGYYNSQKSSTMMRVMYEEGFVPNDDITSALSIANENNGYVLELMITTDDSKNKELYDKITKNSGIVNEIFSRMDKEKFDEQGSALWNDIKKEQASYRIARNEVIALAMQNKNAEAYMLYTSKLVPVSDSYIGKIRKLSDHYSNVGKKINEDNQAAATATTQLLIMVFFVSLVAMSGFGFFISKVITVPLQRMVAICGELAQGDFRDKPRAVLRKDEIGQLADSLADMRANLRKVLKHVNESSEQVAAASEELTASADQSAHAATSVAISINNVATGAENQLRESDTTAGVVEQMSAGIEQVAATSNQVASQSVKAAQKAKDGNAAIEEAVTQMAHIEESVNNSAQVVTKLGERSKEIGQIVDTISGIAAQTNLLALNAAIEAARAGEQGRGFAVVADEVRKLAEQSQNAAKQISGLISEIQGETDKAVKAMAEGTKEVNVGAKVVNTAGVTFEEISHVVTDVAEQVREISAVMQQLAGSSQQIVLSVREINKLCQDSSGEVQSVSAATEEQTASMEEIASASQSLAQLAQDLQISVSKFRI
nr:methyl-accepting chemotaxis protein [uncultured Anaeromusa sp.]